MVYGYKIRRALGLPEDRDSIYDGYTNKVSTDIVGHICNCEFLTVKENSSKNKYSSVSLPELKKEIKVFTL